MRGDGFWEGEVGGYERWAGTRHGRVQDPHRTDPRRTRPAPYGVRDVFTTNLKHQYSILNTQTYCAGVSVGTGVFVSVGIAVGGEVLDGVGVSRKSGLRVRVTVGTKVLVGGGGLVKVALGSCGAEVGGRTPGVVGVRVGVRVVVRVAVAEPG